LRREVGRDIQREGGVMSATTLVGDLINWSKCKTSDGKESLHSPIKTAAIDLGIDPMGYSEECDIADLVFEEIVERIEREYLERPKFEDGTPVQFGDKFIIDRYMEEPETLTRLAIFSKEALEEFGQYRGIDPVYEMNYIRPACEDGRIPIIKRYVEDTQEKINNDAIKNRFDYWNCLGTGCSNCPNTDRIEEILETYEKGFGKHTSCERAMRLDLLARQRKLDGVE
jgi:hypothetical protein